MTTRKPVPLVLTILLPAVLIACGSDSPSPSYWSPAGPDAGGEAGAATGGAAGQAGSGATGGSAGAQGGAGGASTGGAGGSSGSVATGGTAGSAGPVTPEQLIGVVQSCAQLPGTQLFATDSGESATIAICQLNGAVWWTSDMDIDCDGGLGTVCQSDPWYSAETSTTDSKGNPLDASSLPFIVIPLPSNGFDYAAHGIGLGSVAAVLYNGKLEYAIFGDQGPKGVIGEGSFALAEKLGIDSNPSYGGVDSGVTFIVFTGADGEVTKNEDHAEAVSIGEDRARKLLQAN